MNLKNNIYILLFAVALAPLSLSSKESASITEYKVALKEFERSVCTPGTLTTYTTLYRKFRGDGSYIPLLQNGAVDVASLQKNQSELLSKMLWIKSERERLEKRDRFTIEIKELHALKKMLTRLLQDKKEHFFLGESPLLKARAQKNLAEFKKVFFELYTQNLTFLLGYNYPVNHELLRSKYEQSYALKTDEAKKATNNIYLYRRLVEDGAMDLNHTLSDNYLRTAISTLSIRLESESSYISENSRSDFLYIYEKTLQQLKRGKLILSSRLSEWEERTKANYDFYESIIKNQLEFEKRGVVLNEILQERTHSLQELKSFILKKQAESYEFWSKRSELLQFQYALETILLHEVGSVGRHNDDQREHVAEVVYNRSLLDKYNVLTEYDDIFPYLSASTRSEMRKYKWLNVLFKRGEFSFTHFFIPSTIHIFCPDRSKLAEVLRSENLQIAQNILDKSDRSFKGIRYFSRVSMLGRYSMETAWSDYLPVSERPGKALKKPDVLKKILKDQYEFLYALDDAHFVAEVMGEKFVISKNKLNLFRYENPHLFKFFIQK